MQARRSAAKPIDLVIISLAIAATAWSALQALDSGGELRVSVSDGAHEWVYPLDEPREIAVAGPLGITNVHIEDGAVFVHASPCANQVCVAAGRIDKPGQWVACLPNKVFVRIDGSIADTTEMDAGSY